MSYFQFWSKVTASLISICWTVGAVSENEDSSHVNAASSCGEEPIGQGLQLLEEIVQSQNCGHTPGCLAQLECVLGQAYPKHDDSVAEGLGRAGTYGEITPEGVATIFDSMGTLGAVMGLDDAFFDLGSGVGKMVVQSHLTTKVGSSIGIELDAVRHQQAVRVYDSFMSAAASSKLLQSESYIGFVQGDVLDTSLWANASAVYASVLCFPPELLVKLSWLFADTLQPGAVVFSLMPLPGCHRGLWHIGSIDAQMTWTKKFEVHVYVVPPSPFAPPTWLSVDEEAWEASRRKEIVVKEMSVDEYVSQAFQQWDCSKRVCTKSAARRSFVSLLVRKEKAKRINGLSGMSTTLSESDVISAIMGKLRGHEASAPDCLHDELEAILVAENGAPGPLCTKLMDSVSNINVVSGGTTVFHALARSFSPSSVAASILFDRYADMGIRDKSGKMPIHYAAQFGHAQLVKSMLTHRADVNVDDNVSHSTPLHVAVQFAKADAAKVLLEAGAHANALDSSGKSPLHLVRDGHGGLARSLVEHHADANQKDRYGKSPLHQVAGMGSTSLLELFLEFRADVNTQDSMGNRPLHASVARSSIDTALLLLEHEADVNARSKSGVTALAQATMFGHVAMVDTLISQRASPSIGDRTGILPLSYAQQSGHAAMLEALQSGMQHAQEL